MEAVRRVLILENPGSARFVAHHQRALRRAAAHPSRRGGAVAPAYAKALRFIVEGAGAYTAVDGERTTMAPGDFIITPSWTWHDHGNDGDEPVVWLDGLDIPDRRTARRAVRRALPGRRCSRSPAPKATPMRAGAPTWRSSISHHDSRTSPVFNYPYAKSRAALAKLAAAGVRDPAHGVRMRYVNPVTGGWAMPTLGTFLQLLPRGFRGAAAPLDRRHRLLLRRRPRHDQDRRREVRVGPARHLRRAVVATARR